ncbi:MAG: hypothetical protein O2856_03825 [Planctomycetota bacterium]|nr:hypothetical protein [Planctomycetota bacterium]
MLRDDGLSYMAYTEQITFLLFLKMADEQTRTPYNRDSIVLQKYSWESLKKLDGEALELHYRHRRRTAQRVKPDGEYHDGIPSLSPVRPLSR